MSYVPDFAVEAKASWLMLDVFLQEAVLDAPEVLAATPQSQLSSAVSDFTIEEGNRLHYVFLEVRASASGTTLEVLRVGHFARPLVS